MKNCSLPAQFGVRNWRKLWEEAGSIGLSGHTSSSCRLDVSRGRNKMQKARSKGMLLGKGATERRSESGSPTPTQVLSSLG